MKKKLKQNSVSHTVASDNKFTDSYVEEKVSYTDMRDAQRLYEEKYEANYKNKTTFSFEEIYSEIFGK